MFKKLMWKMFPPKAITQDDIDSAKNAFDNARNSRRVEPRNIWGYDTSNDYTERCRQYYMDVIMAKKNYEDYLNSL